MFALYGHLDRNFLGLILSHTFSAILIGYSILLSQTNAPDLSWVFEKTLHINQETLFYGLFIGFLGAYYSVMIRVYHLDLIVFPFIQTGLFYQLKRVIPATLYQTWSFALGALGTFSVIFLFVGAPILYSLTRLGQYLGLRLVYRGFRGFLIFSPWIQLRCLFLAMQIISFWQCTHQVCNILFAVVVYPYLVAH